METPKQPQPPPPPQHHADVVIQFTWDHLIQALKSEIVFSQLASQLRSTHETQILFPIATDTRSLQIQKKSLKHPTKTTDSVHSKIRNPLFIALDGKHFKGIDFITHAYTLGVKHFIFDVKYLNTSIPSYTGTPEQIPEYTPFKKWIATHDISYLAVTNTTTALGRLAQYKLRFLEGIKVGITGSAGKTSTKDFIKQLLQTTYQVYSSPYNFNNAIGLPLSVLALTQPYDFYLFEMGMNTPGEINWLAEIVQPDFSIVTNILPAHFGNFGSLKKIAMAKCEIFNFQHPRPLHQASQHSNTSTTQNDTQTHNRAHARDTLRGKVFYPTHIHEAPLIHRIAQQHNIESMPYDETSFKAVATLSPTFELGSRLTHQTTSESYTLNSCSPFIASLLALGKTLTQTLKLAPHTLKIALKAYAGTSRRLETKCQSPKLIDDAYNANPSSMQNVINFFTPLANHPSVHNLVFILGDMLELGSKEMFFHQQLAQLLNSILTPKNTIFCYGPRMLHTYTGLHHVQKYHFLTPIALIQTLLNQVHPKDILIFKGSNGMQMEKMIEQFLQKLPKSVKH